MQRMLSTPPMKQAPAELQPSAVFAHIEVMNAWKVGLVHSVIRSATQLRPNICDCFGGFSGFAWGLGGL
eukprot:456129-Prymnesium_polylepis.1